MCDLAKLCWLLLLTGGLFLVDDFASAETRKKKKSSKSVESMSASKALTKRKSGKKPDGVLGHRGEWSAGIGAGTWGHTGIAIQKSELGSGALNLGVGFSTGSLLLHGDWIFYFNDDFGIIDQEAGERPPRGQIIPWSGIGGQVGHGAAIRFPAGFQYTMVEDPVNLFGSAVLQMGQAFRTIPRVTVGGSFSIWLGVQVGVRILL